MSSRRYSWVAIAVAMAWLLPGTLQAQTGTSTIAGVVRDSTGAALPGASVKVVNEDTRVSVDTQTNGEGIYRVPALVPVWAWSVPDRNQAIARATATQEYLREFITASPRGPCRSPM